MMKELEANCGQAAETFAMKLIDAEWEIGKKSLEAQCKQAAEKFAEKLIGAELVQEKEELEVNCGRAVEAFARELISANPAQGKKSLEAQCKQAAEKFAEKLIGAENEHRKEALKVKCGQAAEAFAIELLEEAWTQGKDSFEIEIKEEYDKLRNRIAAALEEEKVDNNRILNTEYSEESYWNARIVSMAFNLPDYDAEEWEKDEFLNSETKVKKYKAAFQITDAYIQRVLGSDVNCYEKETIERILAEASEERKKLASGELSKDDLAYCGVIENAMSFNGDGRGFRNVDAYDRSKIDFAKKMHNAAKRFTDITPLLDRLEVRCGSYEAVMEEYGNGCIYFCDPPYYKMERAAGAGNVYKHEFSVDDHIKLICNLEHQNNWLLCGYKKDEQDGLEEAGIDRTKDIKTPAWQRRIYGVLRDMYDVSFVDLGAITRGSSSIDRGDKKSDDKEDDADKLSDIPPHEILWYRQRNIR